MLLQLKNLARFLSLDSMHCLSLGVVFLYVGPPQTSYFVVDNYLLNIGKKMSSITNYVRCKQSPECLIDSLRSERFRAV